MTPLKRAAIDASGGIRHRFEVWQSDIEMSINEWIKANGQAMVYSTAKEKDNVGTLQPIIHWAICRLPVLAGVPSQIIDFVVCGPLDVVLDVMAAIGEAKTKVFEALADSGIPVVSQLSQKFLDITDELPFLASNAVQRAFERVFGRSNPLPNLHFLHHAFASNGDDKEDLQRFHSKMRKKIQPGRI
eukprot:Selendium_serpulae@DN2024_c0_g1_i4.p2